MLKTLREKFGDDPKLNCKTRKEAKDKILERLEGKSYNIISESYTDITWHCGGKSKQEHECIIRADVQA